MNQSHIHLLLNHLPIIGVFVGSLLLLVGVVRRSDELQRVSFAALVLTALVTIPVFFTGEGAEEIVEELPGVTHEVIEEHEESALISFIGVGVLVVVAFGGLWRYRRATRLPASVIDVTLALALLCSGLTTWTGLHGGRIRHTEVRADFGGATEGSASRR